MTDPRFDLDTLLGLVTDVVGAGPAGPEDNFFDLGGDSLHAAHLAVLLDEDWNLPVDVMVIIGADTLREMYDGLVATPAGTTAP